MPPSPRPTRITWPNGWRAAASDRRASTAEPFSAWIDDWAMEGPDFDNLRLTAIGRGFCL